MRVTVTLTLSVLMALGFFTLSDLQRKDLKHRPISAVKSTAASIERALSDYKANGEKEVAHDPLRDPLLP